MAALVVSLAKNKAMPTGRKDPRPADWENAKAIGRDPEEKQRLMEIAGWLRKGKTQDTVAIQRVMRFCVQRDIANWFAYFNANGTALNSILGERAVQRHEREREKIAKLEAEMGLTRNGEPLA